MRIERVVTGMHHCSLTLCSQSFEQGVLEKNNRKSIVFPCAKRIDDHTHNKRNKGTLTQQNIHFVIVMGV